MNNTSCNSPPTDSDEAPKREYADRQQSSSWGNRRNFQSLNIQRPTTNLSSSGLAPIAQTEEIPTIKVSWDANGTTEPPTPLPIYVRDGMPTSGVSPGIHRMPAADTIKNSLFLPKDADTYRLETFKKNKMIIFNQINIPGYKPRYGTMKDVEALVECFSSRGFEVECADDSTRDQFYTIMELATTADLSDYGCFAVVVLTHGSDDGKLLTKDHPIYETEIIEYLKGSTTPSLITKPRLLIVQACRGDEVSSAVTAGDFFAQSITRDSIKEDKPYKMANETDLLLLHSAYPGMVSHRGELEGTWFIQSLCGFINNSKPDDDILSITRQVIHDVSINFEVQVLNRESGILETDKQVPVVTTTLSRKLCLNTMVGHALEAPRSNIEIKSEAVEITSYHSSSTITDSVRVQNMTEEKIVFQTETHGQRQLPDVDTRLKSSMPCTVKYATEDFRLNYFCYVRGMLSKFIDRHNDNVDFLKSAVPLLQIARTIDCQLALSKTREETCLQIIHFLQSQDFDDKEMLFLYKYS